MPLLAPLGLGPWEIGGILLIVLLIFGVGRLPEVGGALGRGIREFRKSADGNDDDKPASDASATPVADESADGVFCGECGTRNARSVKFCSSCGHAIGAAVS